MTTLPFTAKTGSGTLTITETMITLDAPGGFGSQTMLRSAFVNIDRKMVVPSVLGMGGADNLVLYGQGGKSIEVKTVKPKDSKAIQALLTGR